MATRFDGTTWLSRTTNLPTITNFTLMCWLYSLAAESFPSAISIGPNASGTCYLISRDLTDVLQVWTGATTAQGTTSMLSNTWHHVAMTCAGTGTDQLLCYLNGALEITTTGDAGVTNARAYLAQSNDELNPNDCRLAGIKFYEGVLSESEIRTEMRSTVPVRTAGLTVWSPLLAHSDLNNYAGGVAWTASGTLTTEDGPPVPWRISQRRILIPVQAAEPGVILIWTGTHATIPSGWHRYAALDGRYPKGAAAAAEPGGTGGALTHSHTTTSHIHSTNHTHTVPNTTGSAGASARDTGTTNPPAVHTHGSNPSTTNPTQTTVTADTPTTDALNHEPAYATVIFVEADGTVVTLPANIVGLWNKPAGAPANWALCDGVSGRPDLRTVFVKGAATAADAGGTGGATTHSHTIASHTHSTPFAHTHPTVTSSQRTEALTTGDISGVAANVATGTHTHALTIASASPAITGATDVVGTTNSEPPYWVLAYVQNISGGNNFPNNIIGLWGGTLAGIPTNWLLCDGTNGTPDLRTYFIKGATTLGGIGTSGGTLTHGHTATGHTHAVAAHVHTVSGAAGASESRTAGATNAPTDTHTHTWPNTGSSSFASGSTAPTVDNYTDTQPPYTTVVFLEWHAPGVGGTILPTMLHHAG
jgi:hypothetical protein